VALPLKKDVAQQLLLRGSVFVHLDPRRVEVEVPSWLSRQPQLVLQIGLDLAIPIPDLRVDDDGVCGTLSFQREGHFCRVPWDAIFAVVGEDGRGMVWPEDLPLEIAAEVERETARRAAAASSAVAAAEPPHLSLVEGGADATHDERTARRAHLRLVK
jgi:stringent starvation protein B